MTTPHPEEIRFAVVLNGGVSLAVWMGGVVLELDRLTRAMPDGDPAYRAMLNLVDGTARADVITGTSAGGINGAALALSQVNKKADLSALRNMWVEHGRFDELLRQPFKGQPPSLLRGDEYFLPRLEEALSGLTTEFEQVPSGKAPIDLRITTTLLNGVPKVSYDDLGQELPQTVHQGVFSFRRDPPDCGSSQDDFVNGENPKQHLVTRLALAARSTASFPFAFEPSHVPVPSDDESGMGKNASWYSEKADRARFAVDGGVLVNTPTKEALEAIDRMPAQGRVRRIMLLVFPHAPDRGEEPEQDEADDCPTALKIGGKLLGALYSQSGRTYVDRVEEHNRAAASRRTGRNALLNQLYDQDAKHLVPQLYRMARVLFGQYREVRIRYAAKQLAGRLFDDPNADTHRWSFERVRAAAEAGQRAWPQKTLPYVPDNPAPHTVLGEENCWPWGFTMADRLASATLDLLKRLVWVVPRGSEDADKLATLRQTLHKCRAAIRNERAFLDEGTSPCEPDKTYWLGRLKNYNDRLCKPDPRGTGARVRSEAGKIGDILLGAKDVLERVPETLDDMGGLKAWRELLNADQTFTECRKRLAGAELLLSRLLALEISATCVGDVAPTGLDQPVELMQVSLRAENPFAEQTRTPDDKAAGASLGRFSGFLKRSWRVNDWIWGRLDAATMLCRVVLSQERLHRQYTIEEKRGDTEEARTDAAARAIRELVTALFGSHPVQLKEEKRQKKIDALVADAIKELTEIYGKPVEELEPTAPKIAELVAWGLHMRIVSEDLGALKDAILADANDGANVRSSGALFVAQHAKLLDELEVQGRFDPAKEGMVDRAMKALTAFDQAKIGREPLGEEFTGDQMIRTAATAAAVAVSVLDSDQSGLGVAKPVTRTLRGATLLPYWAIIGLTKGSRIAQAGGLLAITLGAAMLMLAMFSLLPEGLTAPAAALGAGMLLTAFGYAALRSRTMLHGLVLLSPVIPLAVHAIVNTNDPKSTVGVVSLGGVAAVVVAMMILGSVPVVRRTPFALISDVWVNVVAKLMYGLAIALGAVIVAAPLIAPVRSVVDFAHDNRVLSAFVLDSVLIVAAVMTAWWQGQALKRWQVRKNDSSAKNDRIATSARIGQARSTIPARSSRWQYSATTGNAPSIFSTLGPAIGHRLPGPSFPHPATIR
ncbi:patatin-like protein [Lentzea sp. NEAU-D13]|uniref:Patatin-like protein n=1 Tax=Lentzea alba TaxID=2714351 RepID=A0A7C9RWR1_9PSEU|nr:patatin-like protein [Lentzea alba]NGY65351.1 patatin-like protein [Lentzea alba]